MKTTRANLHLFDDFLFHNPELGDRWLELFVEVRNELLSLRKREGDLDQQVIGMVGNRNVGCYIKKFETEEDVITICLELKHQSEDSLLSQEIVLSKVNGQWRVNMSLASFPECETPAGALFKLSDWLLRMGLAASIDMSMEQRLEALTDDYHR
ncbi:hypothetical protein [Lonsdalea britannica]|uniref:hypothetical protein n=1 Tax=Lonsdalea britannica TaxID=1082704 RepID=UPI0026F32955|nr:hypothetical protein [Lonsdalea britannica]